MKENPSGSQLESALLLRAIGSVAPSGALMTGAAELPGFARRLGDFIAGP